MSHKITYVDPRGYVHFSCPQQPQLELRSYAPPLRCPICRHISPIKGVILAPATSDSDAERAWVTL